MSGLRAIRRPDGPPNGDTGPAGPPGSLRAAGLSEYAMSRENVEVLHRAFDAFRRRDLDAFLALCDPEVEFISETALSLECCGPAMAR